MKKQGRRGGGEGGKPREERKGRGGVAEGPRPARLIFHKFEKHTRGSRCVNLNFSSAAARREEREGG